MLQNYLRVFSTITLVVCMESQYQKHSSLPNFTKHLIYGNSDLVLSYAIGDGVSFAHATCHRRNERDYYKASIRVYKKCRLTLETTTSMGKSFTQSCDVRLHPKWTGGTVARQFKLVRFGYEHLVFVWRENVEDSSRETRPRRYIPYPVTFDYHKDHLRVEVVYMRNCVSKTYPLVSEQRDKIYEPKICDNEECRMMKNQTEIFAEDEGKIHNVNIVVNGHDSFDVFFRNVHLCGRDRRCKVTYDSHTEKFSTITVPALEAKYDAAVEIYPIVSERESSNILAYAVRSLYLDDGAVTLVSPEGRQIFEHTYSWSPYNLPKGISTMGISTIEETLGICQQPTSEPEIKCSLFDTKGKGLMGVDITLKSSDVALIKMRNTFDGGFLLLIGYGNATTNNGFEALDILRVDSKGELANVHSAKSYKCWRDESAVDAGLIEKSVAQVCYYMACTWPMPMDDLDETHWQLFGECFNESKERL